MSGTMELYEVSVIDSVVPRSRNAKVFVQCYATLAASPLEAAQNVARENTVHAEDKLVVQKADSRTISLGSRHYYPNQIEQRVIRDGTIYTGEQITGE